MTEWKPGHCSWGGGGGIHLWLTKFLFQCWHWEAAPSPTLGSLADFPASQKLESHKKILLEPSSHPVPSSESRIIALPRSDYCSSPSSGLWVAGMGCGWMGWGVLERICAPTDRWTALGWCFESFGVISHPMRGRDGGSWPAVSDWSRVSKTPEGRCGWSWGPQKTKLKGENS